MLRALLWLATGLLIASPGFAQSSARPDSASAPLPAQPVAAATVAAAPAAPAVPAPPAAEVLSTSPDYPRGKISGLMFGDLYENLQGDPRHLYDAKGVDQGQANIDGKRNITRDLNGIQMRRVYFQLDNDLTARVATRFRLETDGRELTSGGKLGVLVKNAYLEAKSVIPRGDFYFGEISTPTFENAEAFWQYRAIEKTVADFWGLRPASDLGIELKGFVDPDHHVGYAAMVGDGNGQKTETDRFKTVYLAVPLRFGDLRVEPYVDYQALRVNAGALAVSDTVVNNDQATYRLFAGYEFRRWAVGAEVYDRVNHQAGKPNVRPRLGSLFARGTIRPRLAAFARVDQYAPDRNAGTRVDVRLWMAGVDWQPVKDLHVMPNLERAQYLSVGGGTTPAHHDLQARITLYYLFSRPQS